MRSSLRALWLGVKASYWFIPSLLTVAAFLLALTTIHLDQRWGSDWLTSFSWFEGSRPEGARAQLTVLSSAMITISSTVFAITIAAVAYASGNYGPRLLTNFMNDRGNQFSLGVFIATFAYNLTLLRVVRNPGDAPTPGESRAEALSAFVPQLSMLVSAASAILAVAVLVYFLHHIPASIRINTVLGGIGRRLLRDIERRFPLEAGPSEPEERISGSPINARSIGYIEVVDFAELDEIACKNELTIALRVRTGDFIHPHLPLVEVSGEPEEELQKRILDCFSLGESRTPTQDLEFLIDELVEIALRALSPGINDPFTAVTSMHWMGAALAALADRDLRKGPEQDSYQHGRVQPLADDFDHFVKRSFGALRASAATNPIAAKIFLETLSGVSIGASSARRQSTLRREAEMLVEQAEHELKGPALAEVRERLGSFLPPMGGAWRADPARNGAS
jgi:uncharacterized membrane protein